MMIRQSTEITVLIGPFVDKTDGITAEVGLAATSTEIDKNGAGFGAGPALGTHDEEGWYPITLTTTHTDTLGRLLVKCGDAATHLPVWREFNVVEEQVWDSLMSSDKLQVHAAEISANLIDATAIAANAFENGKFADGAIDADVLAADTITEAKIANDALSNEHFADWSATRGLAGTALPDAAADAAGGLPISDAGGLDMDALSAGTPPSLVFSGTFNATTQTDLALQGTSSPDDDAYNNMVVVLIDQSTSTQVSVRTVSDYTAIGQVLTIDSAPDFTVVNGDLIKVIAVAPGSTPPTASQVADAVLDEALSGHTGAGSLGKAVADIETDATAILVDTGTDGVVLANDAITAAKIAANAITSSELADGAITAAKFAANAITSTVVADSTITAAKLATGAIASAKFAAGAINAAAIASSAFSIAKFAADVGTTAYASNPLAKAIWERLTSALTTAGSAGKALVDVLADTNELQTDDIPTTLATLATAANLATADGKIDTIDGIVDAILVDTAEIGAAGVGLTEAGGDGDHLTEAGGTGDHLTGLPEVDADVKKWLGVAVTASTNDVPDVNVIEWLDTPCSTPTNAGVPEVDVIQWLGTAASTPTTAGVPEVDVIAINGVTAAAVRLALACGQMIPGTVSHDNTAATTTVFYSDDITEATADHYIGRIVIFTTGDLAGQATDITDYALDTGEGKFTVTALTEAPADNATFLIV